MANYSNIKSAINTNITTNGREEITGAVLNGVLQAMVTALGAGYQYMGTVTPESESVGTPDYRVFYLATAAGTYSNFGGTVVTEPTIFYYDTGWNVQVLSGSFGAALRAADVADNLTTNDATKVLSAKQGKVLKDGTDQLSQDVNVINETLYSDKTVEVVSGYWDTRAIKGVGIGETYTGTLQTSASNKSAKFSVSKGDIIIVKGNGALAACSLCLITDVDNVTNYFSGVMNSRNNPLIRTIEEDGYVYVNFYEYDALLDSVEHKGVLDALRRDVDANTESIEGLNDVVEDLNETVNGTLTPVTETIAPTGIGNYINSSGYSVGDNFEKNSTSGSTAGYANYKIQVKSGDVCDIYAYGSGNTARLYVLTNSSNVIVALVGNKNTHETPEILNIASDGWLYVNDLDYSAEVGKVVIHRTVIEGGLAEQVEDMEGDVSSLKKLSGKNILIFGDSMSTAKDSAGKTYADYVGEKTGANIINIAIGGTRFSQRNAPTLTPTTNSAWGNLDICNMVYAVCEQDFTYADAAVETLSRFSDIIALAKTVDPEDIDIIILEGGGNDYINGHNLGTVDSTDKSTTLGALNYMIQELSTTFPKAKIIGESNQVLYSMPPVFDPSESYVVGDVVLYSTGEGSEKYYFINNHTGAWDANDVRVATPLEWRKTALFGDNDARIGDLTFRELIQEYAERFGYYHIPYANMYETMGWNEYNFSSHYPDTDNHHPNDMVSWADHLIGYLYLL